MQTPSIGRIVHYKSRDTSIRERPAIIVRVWGDRPTVESLVQLQVFYDGSNDGSQTGMGWHTSVKQGQEPGEYHFHEDCQGG